MTRGGPRAWASHLEFPHQPQATWEEGRALRAVVEPCGTTRVADGAVVCTAADDAIDAALGASGIPVGRLLVVVRVKPIRAPLPDVSSHVETAVRACSLRVVPDLGRIAEPVVRFGKRERARCRGAVGPGVCSAITATRGFLPLRLCGQPDPRAGLEAHPAAEHPRVLPRDEADGQTLGDSARAAGRVGDRWEARVVDEGSVLPDGNRELRDVVRVEIHAALGMLIVEALTLWTAHDELPGANEDHAFWSTYNCLGRLRPRRGVHRGVTVDVVGSEVVVVMTSVAVPWALASTPGDDQLLAYLQPLGI